MRQQPEVGDAGQLLRGDADQIGIGVADEAGQREMPRPARTAASMSPCEEQRITTVALPRDDRSSGQLRVDSRSAKPTMLCCFQSSRRSGSVWRAA